MNPDKLLPNDEWLQIVQQRVESLGYGSVEITIHDSRIVELDTTKRLRFQQAPAVPARVREKRSRFEGVPRRSNPIRDGHGSSIEKTQGR